MNKSGYKKKLALVIIATFIAIAYFIPNAGGPNWWPIKQKLNYGLDIQGGLHLVMGIDMKGAIREAAVREQRAIEANLRSEGLAFKSLTLGNTETNEFIFEGNSPEEAEKLGSYLNENYATQLLRIQAEGSKLVYRFLDAYLLDFKSKVLSQAIETIRNRIDEFGVAEPSIVAQGEDRILIQLPGMKDAESAKALISTAAKLDFMLVEDKSQEELSKMIKDAETAGNYSLGTLKYSEYVKKLNEDLKDKLPPNTQVLFEKADNAISMESGRIPFLLRKDTGLDGSSLDDARVTFNQFGNPEVSLRFNASGAIKFKELTGQNVGRRMAVVLDKVVKTAPNIQTEIGNGQAVITLGSTRDRQAMMDEAKMIATSLRAGALPATLDQLEERRIGPTLGSDSLKRAEIASIIGAIGVLAIMIVRYRNLGVISGLALILNMGLILTLLSLFKATLTLPGIAGIALTAGVAVDANVLIFERIREELTKGVGFGLAVKEGYSRALSAILDANVAVAGTSVVLLYFGTGPVRGFAVTLLIGILTTLFSQVFVTKSVIEWLLEGKRVSRLSV
jgi:preprotein translocase subunit SecD